MRSYFLHEDETLAYDDPTRDRSYHELYKVYQPQKYVIKECLALQRQRLALLDQERIESLNRLALHVNYADLDLAAALVQVINRKEYDTLQNLIDLNEGILRLIDGSYKAEEVKAIPMTEFVQFKRRWARCPFHADTKPSLYYYPAQNRAHCFAGCGQKNVIQVFAQLNGISTNNAYQQLLEKLV